MQDEFGIVRYCSTFHQQFIQRRTESNGCDGLCFTTGEEGGSMGRRQYIHFHCKRTNIFQSTAIQAHTVVQDHIPHSVILQIGIIFFGQFLNRIFELCTFGNIVGCFQVLHEFGTNSLKTIAALVFWQGAFGNLVHFIFCEGFHFCKQFFVHSKKFYSKD